MKERQEGEREETVARTRGGCKPVERGRERRGERRVTWKGRRRGALRRRPTGQTSEK